MSDDLLSKYKSAIIREHELELANESLKRDASTWERRYNEQTKLAVEVIKDRDELSERFDGLVIAYDSREKELHELRVELAEWKNGTRHLPCKHMVGMLDF